MVEPVVALSVLLLGGMVLFGRGLPAPAAALLFAFAGLFHGAAYGEAVIGAEPTPVVGLSRRPGGRADGDCARRRVLWCGASGRRVRLRRLQPRLAGAVCAGIGLAFTVEALEGALLG